MTWMMPPETARQERIWMAFPPLGASVFDTAESAHAARTAWAAVAHAVLDFEPVTVVVDPADRAQARRYLSAEVELVEAPLDDAWMRDIGPTFVLDEQGRLGAVDWVFNGWGGQDWARWEHDRHIGALVGGLAGAELIGSTLVNEGGGIQVDGRGTVLVTETVQLDPGRNPGIEKSAVAAELARTIGARHLVWLPRGLTRDSERFGTRGHVDIVAAVPAPGRLLVHAQRDRAHPDARVTAELVAALRETHDVDEKPWEIVEVPAPRVLRDAEGWVDYSYINHLVVNDGVIGCGFGDPNDAVARDLLAEAYPGRRVVTVDAREIFARGGGIHCITQQQPAAR
ncbi:MULTISPECIES: agmatine/peptidylarginine deiminase [unclassified Nocardia]|uniref:agmatine deiminase family protein n=1 Tax=unclassified Nocardia TaxID=2637762 RepID=UPI001CE49231|nr:MULTISPECIES: agmatine deiminase family protein [unclassified Nocardia]